MRLLLKIERFEIPRLGGLVSALRLVDLRDVVQRDRNHDVRLSRRFLEGVERAAENIERLRLSRLAVTKIAERHPRQRGREMVGAQGGFVDGDRARNIPLGILQPVLGERDLAEAGQDGGNVGMIGAERLLADGEGASQRCFGLGRVALGLQGLCKNDKGCRRQGRLPARGPFRLAFKLSRQRHGVGISPLLGQRRDSLHQRQHVLGAGLARPCNGACEECGTEKPRNKSMNSHARSLRSAFQRLCYRYAVGPQQGERPDSAALVRAAFSKTCCG